MNGKTDRARHVGSYLDGATILGDEHGCLCVRGECYNGCHEAHTILPLEVGSWRLVSLVFCMGIE